MPGENLTRAEAAERASIVATQSYEIDLDLTTGPTTFASTTVVRFTATPGASTFVDLVAPTVREVTLNGRVLPIGGVKQKLLAAQRAGLSTVFIPQRNEPDLDDVPAEVLAALDVKPMTDVADIVAQALEPAAQAAPAAA